MPQSRGPRCARPTSEPARAWRSGLWSTPSRSGVVGTNDRRCCRRLINPAFACLPRSGASVAAGASRRAAAAGAVPPVGQSQDYGPLAIALLQLPGPVSGADRGPSARNGRSIVPAQWRGDSGRGVAYGAARQLHSVCTLLPLHKTCKAGRGRLGLAACRAWGAVAQPAALPRDCRSGLHSV